MKFSLSFVLAATCLLASSQNSVSAKAAAGAAAKKTGPAAPLHQWVPQGETKFPVAALQKKAAPAPTTSKKAAIVMGLALALNSGFLNGLCLSGLVTSNGAKQAVSAVTASWTNSALGLASGNMGQFSFLVKVLASFIAGSTLAGVLNPNPSQFAIKSKGNSLGLLASAALLIAAVSRLGSDSTVKSGLLLVAMANGCQNSITSTLTGNLCRTSHYTGISSDMGTFLGQLLAGNKANLEKLKVFAGLALCFWTGGYLSLSVAKQYGAYSLLFSVGLYILLAAGYDSMATLLEK